MALVNQTLALLVMHSSMSLDEQLQIEDRAEAIFRSLPNTHEMLERLIRKFHMEIGEGLGTPFLEWVEDLIGAVDIERTVFDSIGHRIAAVVQCTTTDKRWGVPKGMSFYIHRTPRMLQFLGVSRASFNRAISNGKPISGVTLSLIDEWPLFYHIDACWTLADIKEKAI